MRTDVTQSLDENNCDYIAPFLLIWLYENGLKQTDAPMGGSADESSAEEEYAVEKYDGVVELFDMSKELVQRSRGLIHVL